MATTAIDTRLDFRTAFTAVRALQADPEDTRQVFIIFDALRGRSSIKAWQRFQTSTVGRQVLAKRRVLLDRLSDTAALAALPEGSVGRTYLAFMEGQNLSADGLVAASQNWEKDKLDPDIALFRNRMRDAHDLTHILTGYGRDQLGELCLLAFMNRHLRQLGQLLIIAMSWTQMQKAERAAVVQAWRDGGKTAQNFMLLDYEALLARPLDEVRRDLGIPTPTRYQAVAP